MTWVEVRWLGCEKHACHKREACEPQVSSTRASSEWHLLYGIRTHRSQPPCYERRLEIIVFAQLIETFKGAPGVERREGVCNRCQREEELVLLQPPQLV